MSVASSIRSALSRLTGSSRRLSARRRPARTFGNTERLEPRQQLSVSVGLPQLNPKSDTGARDGVTSITTPLFAGIVAKGTTAQLEITNVDTGLVVTTLTAATRKTGAWSVAVPRGSALAEGSYEVRAIQSAVGVDPVKSEPLAIRISTRAPTLQSFTFDATTYTATVKFDAPVRGVTLGNFSITGDWLPGWIKLTDKRVRPLGIVLSPSSATAASDTFTVTLGRTDLIESGSYTLRFDPTQSKIVSNQTGVRTALTSQSISAEL